MCSGKKGDPMVYMVSEFHLLKFHEVFFLFPLRGMFVGERQAFWQGKKLQHIVIIFSALYLALSK